MGKCQVFRMSLSWKQAKSRLILSGPMAVTSNLGCIYSGIVEFSSPNYCTFVWFNFCFTTLESLNCQMNGTRSMPDFILNCCLETLWAWGLFLYNCLLLALFSLVWSCLQADLGCSLSPWCPQMGSFLVPVRWCSLICFSVCASVI